MTRITPQGKFFPSTRKLRLGKPRLGLTWRSKRRLPRRSPQGEGGPSTRKLRLGKPRLGLTCRIKRRLPRRSPQGEGGPSTRKQNSIPSEPMAEESLIHVRFPGVVCDQQHPVSDSRAEGPVARFEGGVRRDPAAPAARRY